MDGGAASARAESGLGEKKLARSKRVTVRPDAIAVFKSARCTRGPSPSLFPITLPRSSWRHRSILGRSYARTLGPTAERGIQVKSTTGEREVFTPADVERRERNGKRERQPACGRYVRRHAVTARRRRRGKRRAGEDTLLLAGGDWPIWVAPDSMPTWLPAGAPEQGGVSNCFSLTSLSPFS